MFKTAKSFRHGNGLADDDVDAAADPPLAFSTAGNVAQGLKPSQNETNSGNDTLATTTTTTMTPDAADTKRINEGHHQHKPEDEAKELEEGPTGLGREYPDIPYYGLLDSLLLRADVAVAQTTPQTHSGTAVADRQRSMNAPAAMAAAPAIESLLNAAVRRHGSAYVLSSCGCDHQQGWIAAAASGGGGGGSSANAANGNNSNTDSGGGLTYPAYVSAMKHLFRDLCRLRSRGGGPCDGSGGGSEEEEGLTSSLPDGNNITATATATTTVMCHDTVHLRLSGHPRWRDLSLLLAIEQGRLVLFLSSSSRATQLHLKRYCADLSQELVWVAGAALVAELAHLPPSGVSPVLAVWSAVCHLPLTTLPGILAPRLSSASLSTATQQQQGMNAAAAAAVLPVPQMLEGFQLSIVSSRPFPGAARLTPTVRLEEVAPILVTPLPVTPSTTTTTTGGGGGREGNGQQQQQQQQVMAGRQLTLRIAFAGRHQAHHQSLPPLLVPAVLTALIGCLIDECHLRSFTLTAAGRPTAAADAKSKSTAATNTMTTNTATTTTTATARGLTYVGISIGGSGGGGGVTTRRGPSSQSWSAAFSRLSSIEWFTDADRRRLGLTAVEDDGDEVPLECEFTLGAVRYSAPPQEDQQQQLMSMTRTMKRPRSEDGNDDADSIANISTSGGSSSGSRSVGSAIAVTHKGSNNPRVREALVLFEAALREQSGGGGAAPWPSSSSQRPAAWGPHFRLLLAVTKIMEAPDEEEAERGAEVSDGDDHDGGAFD